MKFCKCYRSLIYLVIIIVALSCSTCTYDNFSNAAIHEIRLKLVLLTLSYFYVHKKMSPIL